MVDLFGRLRELASDYQKAPPKGPAKASTAGETDKLPKKDDEDD